MFRYFVLMWDAGSPEKAAAAEALERGLRATSPSWRVEYRGEGMSVLVAGHSTALGTQRLAGGAGVIVGEIFARPNECRNDREWDAPSPHASFGERETNEVLASRGRCLVSRYWGNYVALLAEAKSRYVVKDPTGSLPCYLTGHAGVRVIFSCLSDCRELRCMRFSVNWEFVRKCTVNGIYDVETPPLVEVSGVHRGECVRLDETGRLLSRSHYWHPMSFTGADDWIDDPCIAERALRSTVRSCVHSLAAHHSRVLQQTSGGLDSSIVLGCLGQAPNEPDIACYTAYVPGSVCDERRWARLAAEREGYRHVEVGYDPTKLLFDRLPALAPSVEPASYFSHWQRGPVERHLAREHGASAVFTGEGGDATFCSTCYVLAVDHSLARYGLGRRTLRTALSVASRRDRTLWKVLAQAMRRRLFGMRLSDHRALFANTMQLVAADAKASVKCDHFPNPWFSAYDRVPLETLRRLGTLAFRPTFYDLSASQREEAPLTVSPLCAQPVFELAARIPVDIHFDSGRIRGLARRAFTQEVPEPILRRQWKDLPLLQSEEVVQCNSSFIRDALLDGALTRERILDRAAVELALSKGPSKSRVVSGEILRHLDLELWVRHSG
jgi:asparagine synthase (glutamine-hydrolysing)